MYDYSSDDDNICIDEKLASYLEGYKDTIKYCKDSFNVFENTYFKVINELKKMKNDDTEHVFSRPIPTINEFTFQDYNMNDLIKNHTNLEEAFKFLSSECERINRFEERIIQARCDICQYMNGLADSLGIHLRTCGDLRKFMEEHNIK